MIVISDLDVGTTRAPEINRKTETVGEIRGTTHTRHGNATSRRLPDRHDPDRVRPYPSREAPNPNLRHQTRTSV